jgi:hypothetical protein
MNPLEAKPKSQLASIQTESTGRNRQIPGRHRPATLHALQLTRQVPRSFSAEGTSLSISRAVAPAGRSDVSQVFAACCDNLANRGRFG